MSTNRNDTLLLLTNSRGLRFAIVAQPKILGRSPSSDFVVDSASVSRAHAKLSVQPASIPCEIVVEDLGSLNGTFVGGQRVTNGRATIGELIRFGNVEFCLHDGNYLDDESTVSAPPQVGNAGADGLSPAQKRVLAELLEGNSEKDVATKLKLSPHTVHNHVREIYARFGVHSRPELMAQCLLPKEPDDNHES